MASPNYSDAWLVMIAIGTAKGENILNYNLHTIQVFLRKINVCKFNGLTGEGKEDCADLSGLCNDSITVIASRKSVSSDPNTEKWDEKTRRSFFQMTLKN